MYTRRRFMCHGTGALLTTASGLLGYNAWSQNRPDRRDSMITPQAERSVQRGLSYLARAQNANGSFGTGRYMGDVAVTSLGGLAFMAGGSQPGRGTYGRHVRRAVDYVVSCETPFYRTRATPGFLYNRTRIAHGPMYGHGFGTLFLAEAYGMVRTRALRTRLRSTLRRAVQLIIRAQNAQGGWRYNPYPSTADISVTVCQMMALRAARNAGFAVPNETMERGSRYVKSCQDLRFGDGGFRYMTHGGPTGFARTAAGVASLNYAGNYVGGKISAADELAIKKGLDYLKSRGPGADRRGGRFGGFRRSFHYYYGNYYAVQAMWTRGGRYWRDWFPRIRDDLLGRQNNAGYWDDHRTCRHYCTAMACIILQIPNNYLPIFQR